MTVGIKLDTILTGQKQYIWTVGSNLTQVQSHQHQPLLRLFLSTNGGVTTRSAAVVRRRESKKPDKKLGIRSTRRTAPSAPSLVGSCCMRNWPRSDRRLGTSWRQYKTVFTIWGRCVPPNVSQRLHCMDRPPTNERRPEVEKTVIVPTPFQSSTVVQYRYQLEEDYE